MKTNLENTTIRDISYLVNTTCLRADCEHSLETLSEMLCVSDRYKVYLEDDAGRLCGVLQSKQIALEILKLSVSKEAVQEMLPAVSYVLNFKKAIELAEAPVTVMMESSLGETLELMDKNHIREIAVVDARGCLTGTLEAKNILSHYLREKADAQFA